jgi:hypothetical protein
VVAVLVPADRNRNRLGDVSLLALNVPGETAPVGRKQVGGLSRPSLSFLTDSELVSRAKRLAAGEDNLQ